MKNVSLSERILYIDVLRACALLFILLVHCRYSFSCLSGPQEVLFRVPVGDSVVDWLGFCYMIDTGFLMFAFLFGISFFLQMNRAALKGVDFRGRFAWRMALLAGMGLLHFGLFVGDILFLLGVCGLLLIVLWKMSSRFLVVLALCCLFVPWMLRVEWDGSQHQSALDWIAQVLSVKRDALAAGQQESEYSRSFLVTAGDRYEHIKFYWIASFSARFWQILFMSLLGVVCGCIGILTGARRCPLWIVAASVLLLLVPPLILFDVGGLGAYYGQSASSFWAYCLYWGVHVSVAFALVALLYFFYYQTKAKNILGEVLGNAGKATFSCYIMQSLVLVPFFARWGLGYAGKLSPFVSFAIGLMFFGLQVWLCNIWMRRFRYGPLEYLWRSGTYLSWHAFRKQAE